MKKKKLPAPAKKKVPPNGKSPAAASSERKTGRKKAKMELNQKLKGEILHVYTEGWNAYLIGDLKIHGFHLSNNFKIIGSSESEQFNSKKSWLAYCKKTIKQFAGVIRLQNRKIKLVSVGEGVMVVENADIYVLIDKKWSFYSRIRITALLQKEKTGWKYIHQHGSLPDTRANEGEVIATQQIKKENLLLKEAVKRRTIELENKNRELEIEAALERVRAQTMAMHNSEDVGKSIVKMFDELTVLGVDEGTRFGIGILNHDNENNQLWTANKDGEEVKLHIGNLDMTSHPLLRSARNAWKEQVPLHQYVLEGEDLLKYYQMINNAPDYKFRVATEKLPEREFHYGFVFDHGFFYAFSPCEFQPDLIHITQRFSSLFAQTYTRFLDLQKAEGQAREAKIEAALERVRARSMAMHKSDELKDVIQVVFNQFLNLNIHIEHTGFIVDYQERDDMHIWLADHHVTPSEITIPYFDSPHWNSFNEAKENGKDFFTNLFTFEEKNKFYQDLFQLIPELPEESKNSIFNKPGLAISTVLLDNVGLYIENFSGAPYTEEENSILMRFGKVFQQTYTRFLDLQKAEAQARDALIEAALERVRTRTMAMHQSEHILDVIQVLCEQLIHLDFPLHSANIATHFDGLDYNMWIYSLGAPMYPYQVHVPSITHFIPELKDAYLKGSDFATSVLSKEEKDRFYDHLFTKTIFREATPPERKEFLYGTKGYAQSFALQKLTILSILNMDGVPFTSEENQILKRFSYAFEQSYVRFLDLEKAESQAREAQIEAALERVRSRSMAMHKSEELSDISFELVKQVQALGIATWHCAFNIYSEDQQSSTEWGSNAQGSYPIYLTPREGIFLRYYEIGQRGETFHVEEIGEDRCSDHYAYLCTLPGVGDTLLKVRDSGIPFPKSQIDHIAYFRYGYLLFITFEPVPDAHDIFKRFANVFEQTYTRFLDLKKAEVQGREAQIEAALERLRSKTMAMHNSQDVGESVDTLFDELVALGVLGVDERCGIGIMHPNEKMEAWTASKAVDGKAELTIGHIIMKSHPLLQGAYQGWIDKKETFRYILEGENKLRYYDAILNQSDYKVNRDYFSGPLQIVHTDFYFSEGCLYVFSLNQFSAESSSVLIRFASVFGQTYRRYLDLQKAEAQAREAQIEASLERVRGKAMAMHSSEDLAATISAFYHELELFSITPRRCGVGLLNKETRMAELSTMNTTEQGKSIEVIGTLKMVGHPVLEGVFENWLSQNEYHPVLRGNDIKEYYQLIRPQVAFPEYPNDAVQFGYFFFFPEGGVYAWTENELSEDELKIHRRFTTVLSLTYKRYKDLKDAETREMEAVKQAALDRVRADIASMRSTSDLDRITPLIWKELTTLGIPFIRCGVFIMDEEENKVHTYLSTPDGRAIAAYHTPMDNSGGLAGAIDNWRRQNVFVTHWVESDFQKQADILLKQGSISTREQYLSVLPKEGFYLHFLPFRQGMLYVGSNEPLNSDALQLVRSLAEAFSVAYARYEDFTKLESAKTQIERTLVDLKQTQVQLIQSEKMASLGELTAGIAHEIQNPLNFVNNFSEVNKELLAEMTEEIDKGNFAEVKTLAKDVISNEEKINHHGKRADAIVKGMLQHSRSSSGVKEQTDINALGDEYLRLAYHGLRAKDKSFNATMKTDFDENVEIVKVFPQDIGRVILNLLTNAFYVVDKKKKSGVEKYEPTVSLITKKVGHNILISVKDNGNGIPENIKEKIFQPFFTTKPTGQGTGLGLSLSYDIVKAHGGELTVETKEGEGSTFIIQIPV